MKELIKKRWNYVLYEKNANLFISVLCGTVGLYDVVIKLNEEDLKNHETNGESFTDLLAQKIRDNPDAWNDRKID